jgi:hypothetical protein
VEGNEMPIVKTLLDPMGIGRVPQDRRTITGRNQRSWAYQDTNEVYFLGTFPAIIIPPHSSDRFYVVEANDKGRPDIVAYKLYGDPALYWVILWLNDILDPFETIYPGMLLRVPQQSRLAEFGVKG